MVTSLDWMFIWQWGLIGIGMFTVLLTAGALTKIQRYVRDENGRLIKPAPLAGRIIKAVFALVLISFFLAVAYVYIERSASNPRFVTLFLTIILVYYLVLLFDTFIVDILIIVLWHPQFLNLPDTEGFTSIKFHLKTLLPGSLYGMALSLFVSTIAYLLF